MSLPILVNLILLNLGAYSTVKGDSLVTTISISSTYSGYNVDLPLGTPAQQQLSLRFDVSKSELSLDCSHGGFNRTASRTFLGLNKNVDHSTKNLSKWSASKLSKKKNYKKLYYSTDTLILNRVSVANPNTTESPTPLQSVVQQVQIPAVKFRCRKRGPGIAGLGHGKLGLPGQLTQRSGLQTEFAYCLSASGGPLIFGSRPEGYVFQNFPNAPLNLSATQLPRAALRVNPAQGYAVVVTGISVGGEDIPTNTFPLSISTVDTYTRLERSVFSVVRSKFLESIGYGNGSDPLGPAPVPVVAPFDTCFNATPPNGAAVDYSWYYFNLGNRGRVDMALATATATSADTESVTWSLSATDLLTSPSDGILCLAILDAGPNRPSVLGTVQQQGRLLHFDLGSNSNSNPNPNPNRKPSLGFCQIQAVSFPVPFRLTSCSNFVY